MGTFFFLQRIITSTFQINNKKKPVRQARMLDMTGFLKIHYLTASLRALPALKAGTLLAAISITSLV